MSVFHTKRVGHYGTQILCLQYIFTPEQLYLYHVFTVYILIPGASAAATPYVYYEFFCLVCMIYQL